MSELCYLYGFVPLGTAPPPRALSGIDGGAVSLVDAGPVVAVTSSVRGAEFNADAMSDRMQDLNWVGARGLEHERVVAWFVDHAEILPVSLFTLFSSPDAMLRDATARAVTIREQLDRLHDKREWDLKVSWDERELVKHAGDIVQSIRDIDAEIESASAGKKFLLERKRADLLKRDLANAARDRARGLLEELARHARRVVALPIPRTEGLPVVLNAALLVERGEESALQNVAATRAAELALIGMTVQFTGPWAAYRFAGDDDV